MKMRTLLSKGAARVTAFAMAACLVLSSGIVAEAAGTEIFSGGTNETYESNDASWLLNAADTDVITVKYTCTDATHTGWGVLGWGATVDGNWTEGPQLKASETDASEVLTATYTVATLKSKLNIKSGSDVSYIKLGAWNGGKIESLSISGGSTASASTSTSSSSSAVVEEEEETLPPLTGDYLYLIEEAKNITIWPELYLEYWVPGQTIYITVELESNGAFGGALGTSVNRWAWQKEEFGSETGESTTVSWFVTPISNNIQLQLWWLSGTQVGVKSIQVEKAIDYTDYAALEAAKPQRDPYLGNANASSYGYVDMMDNCYWTQRELTVEELLGGVDPADVTSIVFNGETDFWCGYNMPDGTYTQDSGKTSYTVTDINLTDNFYTKLAINKCNGTLYRFTWDVYTNGATPSTDTNAPSTDDSSSDDSSSDVAYSYTATGEHKVNQKDAGIVGTTVATVKVSASFCWSSRCCIHRWSLCYICIQ